MIRTIRSDLRRHAPGPSIALLLQKILPSHQNYCSIMMRTDSISIPRISAISDFFRAISSPSRAGDGTLPRELFCVAPPKRFCSARIAPDRGELRPCSQYHTACRLTPTFCASSSIDIPAATRNSAILLNMSSSSGSRELLGRDARVPKGSPFSMTAAKSAREMAASNLKPTRSSSVQQTDPTTHLPFGR